MTPQEFDALSVLRQIGLVQRFKDFRRMSHEDADLFYDARARDECPACGRPLAGKNMFSVRCEKHGEFGNP